MIIVKVVVIPFIKKKYKYTQYVHKSKAGHISLNKHREGRALDQPLNV